MISTLVIKSIRACNLRCPYCYYINKKTEHYGSILSVDCARRLYAALAPYLKRESLGATLIWHGGEPLLLGRRRFQALLNAQHDYFAPGTVMNCLQTNGVLVDDAWADFFERNDLHVGISLDGPAELHDRLRPKTRGAGSYAEVVRAMQLLDRRQIPFGVIAVASPGADGKAVVRHFRELGITDCDLLIPMTNHALQRGDTGKGGETAVDVAGLSRYLADAFHEWIEADDPSMRVRLFQAMIGNALGIRQTCANAGASAETLSRMAVIETNGDICMDTEFGEIERHGLGPQYRLGMNVCDEGFSFDRAEAALMERIRSRRLGALPDECQLCSVRSVCRGSHPGSRFDDCDGSFNHRSAYCEAMYELSAEVVDYLYRHGFGPSLIDPELRNLRVA